MRSDPTCSLFKICLLLSPTFHEILLEGSRRSRLQINFFILRNYLRSRSERMPMSTNLLLIAMLIACPQLAPLPSAWRSAVGPVPAGAAAVPVDPLFLSSLRRYRVSCQMHCATNFRSCVTGCKRLGGSLGTADRCDHLCRTHGFQCYQRC